MYIFYKWDLGKEIASSRFVISDYRCCVFRESKETMIVRMMTASLNYQEISSLTPYNMLDGLHSTTGGTW